MEIHAVRGPLQKESWDLYPPGFILKDAKRRNCSQSFGSQIMNERQLADVNELHLRGDEKV